MAYGRKFSVVAIALAVMLAVGLAGWPGQAFASDPASGQPPASSERAAEFDALTRNGLAHYYTLEYDQAIREFQHAAELKPEDPQAWNHVLEAVLFRALYKYDALDTSLYTQQKFLDTKQVPMDEPTKKQIKELADKAQELAEKRLKSNPNDVEALYSRGVTKGLRSTYLALIEHSWFAAVRSSLAARNDHEQVLKMDPKMTDAKTIVGAHNYVVGSLPWPVKITIGITGIHGDKNKGLEYLEEAGKAGGQSSADARVALALFLRRENRYDDAIKIVHTLVEEYPKNFLFSLEEANLMKDAGKGPAAVVALRALLNDCERGKYPQSHVELVEFGLGEALRGQGQYAKAVPAYQAAGTSKSINRELKQRSLLAAGELSDLLNQREAALQQYRAVVALDGSTKEADTAKKYMGKAYRKST
jgi:tetratricopeptide (TPR) repeat protein